MNNNHQLNNLLGRINGLVLELEMMRAATGYSSQNHPEEFDGMRNQNLVRRPSFDSSDTLHQEND